VITLLHPGYLVLLALIAGVWIGPLRARRPMQGLLRTALLTLLAIGLARPVVLREGADPTRVWILDRSASVDVEAGRAAELRIIELAGERRSGRDVLILNGGDRAPSAVDGIFDRIVRLPGRGAGGGSPLAAALAEAAAAIPSGTPGRVAIYSDGRATCPDDGRALQMLRARGIPVDVTPLPTDGADVGPAGLDWDDELRVGQTARLRAIVVGRGGAGRVVLADATGDLTETPFDRLNGRTEVALTLEPREPGFQPVTLRVECAGDSRPANNELAVMLPVQDARRILYLGGGLGGRQAGGGARLAEILGGASEVIEPGPGAGAAELIEMVNRADLVLLDDIAADRVPAPARAAIVDAVANDGLGLVMSGGKASFGGGGWHETTIETVLPIELVQKEEKRDPSTTLVVVIDTSGSMSGQRVQLAKETTRLAIRRLMPHDKVGIVEFYGAKRWAAPIQPASNRIEIERALNRLDAGGGTIILPAIEEAFYGLQNINTRYKHVLVLTDGGVEAGAFEPLLRRMAAEGINVTSVLVGGGIHSEFLVNLANWGKGRYYSVPNRFNLPEIIFKQPSSAKLPSYREGTHAVRARGGRGWWGPVDPTSVPTLAGYVETRARPRAEVLLETTRGAHPIITTWRWGLGRVTTIATEPVGAGTSRWREWPEYGQALARLFERTAADGRTAFRFVVSADNAALLITATRLIPDAPGLAPTLHRLDADGDRTTITMEPRSPDRWVARVLAPDPGDDLKLMGGDTRPGGPAPLRLVGPSTTSDEMHVDPARSIDLPALAAATGGRVIQIADASAGAAAPGRGGLRLTALAPWLLLAALGFFLGEVAWRRWP